MSQMAYEPINQLKPVAENVWIVDGPLIHFGPPGLKMPFPTRMTIIRLGGDLFIHSPTALTEVLRLEITALGEPRWLIGPNRIHYWWLPEWHNVFRDAEVYVAPRLLEQAGEHIDFPCTELTAASGYPWDADIATLPIAQGYMTEVEFFHRPSRTLVLTDFIENFEPQKLGGWLMRLMTRLGGVQHPHGGMPRDMRFVFRKHRDVLREAVETMIAWDPERIILAHGRWFERGGTAELKRAFGWLLE